MADMPTDLPTTPSGEPDATLELDDLAFALNAAGIPFTLEPGTHHPRDESHDSNERGSTNEIRIKAARGLLGRVITFIEGRLWGPEKGLQFHWMVHDHRETGSCRGAGGKIHTMEHAAEWVRWVLRGGDVVHKLPPTEARARQRAESARSKA